MSEKTLARLVFAVLIWLAGLGILLGAGTVYESPADEQEPSADNWTDGENTTTYAIGPPEPSGAPEIGPVVTNNSMSTANDSEPNILREPCSAGYNWTVTHPDGSSTTICPASNESSEQDLLHDFQESLEGLCSTRVTIEHNGSPIAGSCRYTNDSGHVVTSRWQRPDIVENVSWGEDEVTYDIDVNFTRGGDEA